MSLPSDSTQPAAARIGPFYTVALIAVLVFDVALALLLAYARANRHPDVGLAGILGETVGYAGCSLLCPLVPIVGIAALVARERKRPIGAILVKALVWCGVTLVPLFLLFMALSSALHPP